MHHGAEPSAQVQKINPALRYQRLVLPYPAQLLYLPLQATSSSFVGQLKVNQPPRRQHGLAIRQERGKVRYKALINPGFKLLEQRGLQDTSIAELAREAGREPGKAEIANIAFAFQVVLGTIGSTVINQPVLMEQQQFIEGLARTFTLVSEFDILANKNTSSTSR